MNESVTSVDRYLADFSAGEARLPGRDVSWVARARRDALDRFAASGFPAPREEEWKYTRTTPIEKRPFTPAEPPDGVSREDVAPLAFAGDEAHRLVFLDGHFAPGLSTLGEVPEGVRIEGFAAVLDRDPEALQPHLGRYADAGRHAFTALNTAFMRDGAFVRLDRDAVVAHPIELLFVATGRHEDVVAHPRVLIVAGPGSRAAIVERWVGLGDAPYFTNALTEVALDASACIFHYKLQHESRKAFHVATLHAHQGRDSAFESHSVSFGGALTRNDIDVVLDAEGSQCTLNGLFMAAGRQHVDYHTRIDHAKPRGTSREHYKSVLDGRARGVFNGLVHVHPDAQASDASLTSNNLLLSRNAEIDTKPELRIYADDVKCSHGATVGQLDEQMLFYLRSRGIPEDAARGLLTYGFAQDIVDRVRIDPIRERLTEELLGRLPQADHVREIVR